MGIKETLGFIFSVGNLPLYKNLFLVLGILTFNGVIIFQLIYRTYNKLLLIGGGMITGSLVFLLILSTFSYFFKGPLAIVFMFWVYSAVCLFIFIKNLSVFRDIVFFKLSFSSVLYVLVILFYLSAIILYSRSYIWGGDVFTYWGIATSFPRGNYPTVLPWQPQFLTTYRDGTFLVQGAIQSLSSINIPLVYSFFSLYMFSALFLLITGIAREKNRSLLSLLPANLGLILFGGPLLYIGDWNNFLQKLVNFEPSFFTQFENFKGSLGSGANSIDGLFYLNFYTFGLGVFFVFLYTLLQAKFQNTLIKYIILVILSVLLLSIAETLFLIVFPLLATIFLLEHKRKPIKKTLVNLATLSVIFIGLFSVVPNIFRDSLLSPIHGISRLKILKLYDSDYADRMGYLKNETLEIKNSTDAWYIPDLRLSLLLVFVISIWQRSKWTAVLNISSLVILILSFLLIDRFWPISGLRFINQSFQLLLFAMGFLIIELLKVSRKKSNLLIGVILLLIILPQLLGSNLVFLYKALYRDGINLTRDLHTKDEALEWVYRNLSYSERIIFIDGYPISSKSSPMTEYAIQFYGIFVPVAPVKVRIKNIDTGGEWYDAMTNLSPSALNNLGVNYVFIKTSEMFRFSPERKTQLMNADYFQPIYQNNTGILYKVSSRFKKLQDKEITLEKIANMIPYGKVVYLDHLPITATRRGFLVELANRTILIGPSYVPGDDYFLYVMAFLPLKIADYPNAEVKVPELKKIDFVITNPELNPNLTLVGPFQKIATMPYVTLWQKHLDTMTSYP